MKLTMQLTGPHIMKWKFSESTFQSNKIFYEKKLAGIDTLLFRKSILLERICFNYNGGENNTQKQQFKTDGKFTSKQNHFFAWLMWHKRKPD